ncbi:MAG TPA: CS1-pili formation C-terminal domain-containing protein [Sphingomicrobium sp.]|nr:CS1-pili formation C-terminal domain-containing protein [Sphingomicrobium sp.]
MPSSFWRAFLAFTVSAAFINGPARASGLAGLSSSEPAGFEDLMSEREVVLDAYFGGRKLGEVRATIRPGFITFKDPQSLARLIPDVAPSPQLVSGLSGPMPANVSLACGPTRHQECDTLQPQSIGVILDEERFSVEIILHPSLLSRPDPTAEVYLAEPIDQPSLISHFGANFSGSSRGGTSWHLQNRSIASVGDIRLRSDSSVADGLGITFDNLTVEADRRDWRFLGGIFWAPGTELIGRRRIIGLGAATQLDTRQNKTELLGTPLEVYLQQTAKVDLLIDGRIVSSRIYPSGNRLVDTAALPDGSYEIVLRIQEDGRPSREEQRFFTKGSSMAPFGRPLFSAFVGMLPSSSRGISFNSENIFYEMGAAYRLAPNFGFDAAIIGTQRKAILETGAVYHSRIAQVRLGALFSTSRDLGIAVRATTVGNGPLSLSFDLRKILSRDGRPLLPVSTSQGTFSEEANLGFANTGSYFQGLSILSYRISRATLRLSGLYRKNSKDKANYSVGVSVETPVVRSSRWNLLVLADARKTERDFSSFAGFRFLANSGSFAVSGSAGMIHQNGRNTQPNRLVGEVQGAWYRQLRDQSQLSTDVAIGQNVDGAYSRASAYMRTRTFNGRADVLHQFGDQDTTQFAATLNTGIVVTGSRVGVAGRDINDTGVTVTVGGGGAGQKFDVLIDEVVRGTVADGGRLVLFLQPYQVYDIRVRSRDSQISGFDATPRTVTLYPGNVAELDWKITPLVILFGRAVALDGKPIANADITGPHGVGRTDKEGYFQIETKRQDRLRLSRKAMSVCTILVDAAQPIDGFFSAGDQICRS